MKKIIAAGLILLLIMIFAACGGDVATQASADSPVSGASNNTGVSGIKIGFSLAGESAFTNQLIADIESECSSYGYAPVIVSADTAEKQQTDIETMFADEVSVIMIDPVDVDSLETVLAECEINNVRVINALDSINGVVDTLISPNYTTIGEKAGQMAVSLLGETGGGCMMLKTKYDSFNMQLISDGFNSAIGSNENVVLAAKSFCGEDENSAYEETKAALSGGKVDFIFAYNAALANGALRAVGESGADVKIAVLSGEMDIIRSVSSGDLYAAIFFGPGELAHQALSVTNNFIESTSYEPPQFIELAVEVAVEENASDFISETVLYAEMQTTEQQ